MQWDNLQTLWSGSMNDRKKLEVPNDILPKTKDVLEHLVAHGFVIFQHDDSELRIVRDELDEIAGAIGLVSHSDEYSLTLVTEDFAKAHTKGLVTEIISKIL